MEKRKKNPPPPPPPPPPPSVEQNEAKLDQSESNESKYSEESESPSAQQSTKSVITLTRKPQKPRSVSGIVKPKLPSLHESCREGEDASNGHSTDETHPCSQCLAEMEDSSERENRSSGKTYFGVKSYLHQFYENRGEYSPGGGREEDYHYLIRPKGRTCGAVLFKIGLITGATLFLLGAVAIIIGYAIPTQEEIRGQTDEFKIMDRNAMQFNRNLDMSKLAGLAMFCSGGIVLVISLLAPTFTSSYWDEDLAPEAFRVSLNLSPIPEDEPRSPIPATEKIQGVQPIWTRND